MRIQGLIEQLNARIPELEWKISQLPPNKSSWRLPRDVFRLKPGSPYLGYVSEVKEDLAQLALQRGATGQHYLAKKIEHKISLLIRMCVLQALQKAGSPTTIGVLQRLSTRQQWLAELQVQLSQTTQQIAAMQRQLSSPAIKKDTQAQLQLQHDIGQALQQHTILKERYQRASSDKSRDSRP